MSINISSDYEESSTSCLPLIRFPQTASTVHRRHSSTFDLHESDKKNLDDDCVDLTQEGFDENDNGPVVLTSACSSRSHKERFSGGKVLAHHRPASVHQPDDADAAFDQLSPAMVTPLSHMDSGVSVAFDQLPAMVAPLSHGDSGDSVRSGGSSTSLGASSGYGSSAGSRRRQSVDSAQSEPSRKGDRGARKRRLGEERLARLAASELNNIYKPAECMKYMQIELHPSLHQAWYMVDLEREAAAAGARVAPSPDVCHEGLLLWSRRAQRRLAARAGRMELTDAKEPCQRALLVQRAEEIAPYVNEHTLSSRVAQLRDIVDCKLTLVVFGAKDYFKSSGRKKQNHGAKMTEIELEMAFTDLLVSADCDVVEVATASELALTVVQFTKAIAEAPHKQAKKACDEQADFYMRGDSKKCVPVDKDGQGLARLWQQMLAVLPHSSLEVARSVCREHRSPAAMCEALQRPNAVNELADLGVDRAGVPGARSRRLGPEFARRLHTLFTADDGNMLVE